jgi:hypothetical protein
MAYIDRAITLDADAGQRTLSATELNTLQASVMMAQEADQEEDGLPASFYGTKTICGEFTLGAGVEGLALDMSNEYWRCVPYDFRDRMCTITLCTVTAADRLPSGANHCPGNIANTYTARFNTKSGQAIGAFSTVAWNPAVDLYIYADSTNGHLYADSGGTGYYFYFMATFTPSITTAYVGDHRQKSMADCARVDSKMIREYEDQSTFLHVASGGEEVAIPATFLGGTRLYGEFTITDPGGGVTKVIDSSRDWREAVTLWRFDDVAAANELPSGANHTPDDSQNPDWMTWDVQGGYAIGGGFPPAANNPVWKPIGAVNLWLFVNAANGNLVAHSTTGGVLYVYFDVIMTAATA